MIIEQCYVTKNRRMNAPHRASPTIRDLYWHILARRDLFSEVVQWVLGRIFPSSVLMSTAAAQRLCELAEAVRFPGETSVSMSLGGPRRTDEKYVMK
jgi:hypothetical protein